MIDHFPAHVYDTANTVNTLRLSVLVTLSDLL